METQRMAECETAKEPKRLTEAQRAMVEEHVPFAEKAAKHWGRHMNKQMQEEILASAMLGLCDAATNFDPSQSSFKTHAARRMFGQVQDDHRERLPKGFRRDRENSPRVQSTASLLLGFDERNLQIDGASQVPSGDGPTSANLEYQDLIAAFSAGLPKKAGEIFRSYHGDAGRRLKEAGKAVGITESRASQLVAQAYEMIRERIENDRKDRLGLGHYMRLGVSA